MTNIDGIFSYDSTSKILIFIPSLPLDDSSYYTISVNENVKDLTGRSCDYFNSSFKTIMVGTTTTTTLPPMFTISNTSISYSGGAGVNSIGVLCNSNYTVNTSMIKMYIELSLNNSTWVNDVNSPVAIPNVSVQNYWIHYTNNAGIYNVSISQNSYVRAKFEITDQFGRMITSYTNSILAIGQNNKFYYGVSSQEVIDDIDVNTLTYINVSMIPAQDLIIDASSGGYIYIVYPQTFGDSSFKFNGFSMTLQTGTITISGVVFSIFKTQYTQHGSNIILKISRS
jgi:hypothetical protein